MKSNIIARLEADASAFTQTTSAAILSMEERARAVGPKIGAAFEESMKKSAAASKAHFNASFAEINRLAETATRGAGGGLQLDLGSARTATAAAREKLAVLEQLNGATLRLAGSEKHLSEAQRMYIAAGQAAITETRGNVAALAAHEAALESLQMQLGQTAGAQQRAAVSAGQMRAGAQQLGFQMSDVATQFAMGASPMAIFIAQGGQVVQALGMMNGGATGLLGVLGSPWTAVVVAAASVLYQLYDGTNKTAEAAAAATKAQEEHARSLDRMARSAEDAMLSVQGLANAEAARAQSDATAQYLNYADALNKVSAARETLAKLERQAKSGGAGSWGAQSALSYAREQVAAAEKMAAAARTSSAAAERLARAKGAAAIRQSVDDKISPDGQMRAKFKAEQDALYKRYEAGTLAEQDYRKALEASRAAEEKAAAAASKKGEAREKAAKLPAVTGSEVARLLGAPVTSGTRTAAQNAAAGGAPNSFHLTGQAIDIPLTVNGKPLTREGIRAALEPAGIKIKELLGPGDKGHSDHWHIAFDKRRQSADQVRQSVEQMIAAETRAKEELSAMLNAITSRYDPLLAMQAEYLDELAKIKHLEDVKAINAEQAASYRHAAYMAFFDRYEAVEAQRIEDISKRLSMAMQKAMDTELVDAGSLPDKVAEEKQARDKAEQEQKDRIERLAYGFERVFTDGNDAIWDYFERRGKRALAKMAAEWADKLMSGNFGKSLPGQFLQKLFGDTGATSAVFGKSITNAVGVRGSTTGAAIGGTLGSMVGGPLGQLAGSIIGSFVGGVLKKTKTGSATLAYSGGTLGVGATAGNNSSRIEAASGAVSSLADTLDSIASALGGTVSGAGSVSIGVRNKKYVVDPTGQGRTKGAGVLKFASEEEAMKAALRDALADGVIAGISAAAQNILRSGKDVQKAIEKAAMIESIPTMLKARRDPMGAALDALNKKWDRMIAALKEGGATAEQMADAEKLYKIERQEAMEAANDNIKSFIDSLNFGSNSAYSLMDQAAAARANLNPMLANIESGNLSGVDRQKYLDAADAYLQLSRELNGSGGGYFADVARIKAASQTLADSGTTALSARDPFAEATADNTQAMAEILSQHTGLLADIRSSLTGGANSAFVGTAFIGTDRGFA